MAIDINVPSQIKNYANLATFPVTGTLKTIFIAEDTNKTYRWTGSAYVEISASQAASWGTITGTLSTQTDLQNALNAKVTGNTAITGATKTKVTFDSKGLVTSGADATTADIADSLNKRYVTDANLTTIANQSGVNTGDQTLAGLGGVPTTRTLTINGTTQDLSADRTFTVSTGITIGTTAITSGEVGRVLFEGTGNVVQESGNLFWDNVNGMLGIGTSSPTVTTEIAGNVLITGNNNNVLTITRNLSPFMLFNYSGGSWRIGRNITHDAFELYNNATLFLIKPNGNVLINTTTDAGFKLDINGTARVSGNVQFGTSFYWDNSNQRAGVRTSTPGAGVDIWNSSSENAQIRISDNRVSIPDYGGVGFSPILSINTLGFFSPWSGSSGGVQFAGFTSNTNSGQPFVFIGHHGGTSPTTQSILFVAYKHNGSNGRTALTGNEIIAGFRTASNPDVLQIKANGRINMSSLPTSPAGLSAGDIWNNLGILNIV